MQPKCYTFHPRQDRIQDKYTAYIYIYIYIYIYYKYVCFIHILLMCCCCCCLCVLEACDTKTHSLFVQTLAIKLFLTDF